MHVRINQRVIALAAVLGLLAASSSAKALPLPPGGKIPNDGAPALLVAGPPVADITAPYAGPGGESGTFREVVAFDAVTGGLDFLFQVKDGTGVLGHVTMTAFSGFTTDASAPDSSVQNPTLPATIPAFAASTIGLDPTDPLPITRSGAGDGGATVGFFYDDSTTMPGDVTPVMVIRTNATRTAHSLINIIDGGTATEADIGPAPAVPEPGSLVLFAGIAVGGLGYLGWRRKKGQRVAA
jgi:hypothetical protein